MVEALADVLNLDGSLAVTGEEVNSSALAASFIARMRSHPTSAVDDILNAVQDFFGGECV